MRDVMDCAACGAANRTGRKFCAACGTALGAECPACGAANEPSDRFCGECGAALPQTGRGAAADERPGPELRHVSVLFCDLVGYTALAEQRDPEDTRAVLSGYFLAARTVIGRYGGTIEKYIGDAVMAVWGAPAAHEDDAERAVRAALDLVDAVAAYGDSLRLSLQARVGVVTGRAAAVTDPREGIVVGDRVNTAQRVQATAAPGTVRVDETTRATTAAAISYTDAGVHVVPGKAEPLRLWRAERVVAGIRGGRRRDELEAPMVGRARELAVVKELFHACAEEGRARLAAVTGQAGVGKTRLLWEFEKYLDGLPVEVFWHAGRCLAYGDGVAYSALAEMVRQRLAVAQEDPPDVVREKLHAGLDRWVPDPAARRYVAAPLGVLLGCDDADLPREELFAGWRLLFEQLARVSPVVLAFDDVQWADPGLLDFIEQVVDWSTAHPILVVVLARPDLVDARPSLLAGRRQATAIAVEPLSDAAIATLLQHLVPDLPDAVRRLVAAHAAGVPLFVLETVRSFLDRGILVVRDGSCAVVGEIDALPVPASLSALVRGRLDALPPEERTLVRDLCVLAGSFPRGTAAAMTDLAPEALERALTGLVHRDVLTVRRDPLSPDWGHYAFGQALVRTVAYDGLSKRERKARHLRAAAHLRAADGDAGEGVEVLASHYRDAWAAVPGDPDADAIRDLAAETFGRAGDRAKAVGGPANAERAYRAAADLARDPEAAARWLAAAADAAFRAGRAAESLALYERVTAEHRAAGRADAARALVAPTCEVLVKLGRLAEAEERLAEALRGLAPDDPATAELVLGLGWVTWCAGDTAAALAHTDHALALAAASGDRALLGAAAARHGDALFTRSRLDEALVFYRWSLELLGPDAEGRARLTALVNTGGLMMGGDLPGTRGVLEEAADLARRLGDTYLSVALTNLVLLDVFEGAWPEGEQRAMAGLAEVPADPFESPFLHFTLVHLLGLRGDVERARVHLAEVSRWSDHPEIERRSVALAARGLIAAAAGESGDALAACGEAVRAALPGMGPQSDPVRLGWPMAMDAALRLGRIDAATELFDLVAAVPPGYVPPFLRAEVSRFRGRLAAARGQTEGVEEALRSAVEQLTALGYPYWRALAQADMAEWLRGTGRPAEASAQLEEAVSTLTALGAAPALSLLARP